MHGNFHIQQKKAGFSKQRFGYENTVAGQKDKHVGHDLALTKAIADVLERHYPSQPWTVEVDHSQGVVFISLPIIMRRNQKYVLHIDRLKSDPGLRSVIRAAGEILERHNVPRSGFRLDHFLHARAANPMNRPRLLIPEHLVSKAAEPARPLVIA